MSSVRAGPWGRNVRYAAAPEAPPQPAPALLFRSRLRIGPGRAAAIAAAAVAAASGFGWFVGGVGAALAVPGVSAATILVGLGVWRRRRLVVGLWRDGDALLIETLFATASTPPLRARLAETEGWRSYVETLGHLGVKTHNRLVVFRHRGIAYAVPVDHGEAIDRAGLAALLGCDEAL